MPVNPVIIAPHVIHHHHGGEQHPVLGAVLLVFLVCITAAAWLRPRRY